MEALMEVLPVILYLLGSVLLVVLIVLGVKLINLIESVNTLVDDVQAKSASLNGFFNVIDNVTDTLAGLSDKFVNTVETVVGKIFRKKNKKLSEEE